MILDGPQVSNRANVESLWLESKLGANGCFFIGTWLKDVSIYPVGDRFDSFTGEPNSGRQKLTVDL
jgi:hypothetical protein